MNESTNDHRTVLASTQADLRELRANSGATVKELKEFLAQLKGKNPQEMLGTVASSQLVRAIITSILLVTASLFALTALPYYLQDTESSKSPAASIQTPQEIVEKPEIKSPPALTEPKEPSLEKAPDLAPLGVNDKKSAPLNSNPLESKTEDFLKDLE